MFLGVSLQRQSLGHLSADSLPCGGRLPGGAAALGLSQGREALRAGPCLPARLPHLSGYREALGYGVALHLNKFSR